MFWVNSLNLDYRNLNSGLYDECRDGVLLALVIHAIDPNAIDLKKIKFPTEKPLNPF